ncbi:3836_t:CDS:2 [Ambispora gerdemannii]|uniref:3836_t:CDS:1 n=1 Tax=Ambispora gerdemannii TaxID=144530 RepID=A0A9N8WGB1_9GLOM|nr:3836_t:CDS:2 [Ambispora gerdemannii]
MEKSQTQKTIAVFGGSNGVGRQFVKQSLDRGHQLRVLVRPTSKSKALEHHPNLTTIYGDAFDRSAVLATIQLASIIFLSIGPGSFSSMGNYPTSKAQRTINEAVNELPEGHIRKMILVSVVGIGSSCEDTPALMQFSGNWLVPKLLDDKRAAEDALKEFCTFKNIEWTALRPAILNNCNLTRKYHASEHTKITMLNAMVGRADVAYFALEELIEQNLWANTSVTLTCCP